MEAKARVLVVDDEPIVIKSCDRVLTPEGIEVKGASCGRDGLKFIGEDGFDVVLLDLKMPDIDGIDVLRRVRKVKPDVAVIIITGYPSVGTAVEAMKLGASDYIVKPFAPQEVRGVVTKAMKHRSAGKGATAGRQHAFDQRTGYSPALGLGRAIHTTTRSGRKVAIIGLAGVFEPDSHLFFALIQSLKRVYLPITSEYGYHEVVGKEILAYLENNDKVIVVASAEMGARPGQIVTFRAGQSSARGADTPLELPQIGFPQLVPWANAIGIDSDLVVIAVEPDERLGTSRVGEGLWQTVVQEALTEPSTDRDWTAEQSAAEPR